MAFLADRALELLRDSHVHGRLAHAYLLTGEPGSGKRDLALRLIHVTTGQNARSLEEARGELVQVVAPESKSRRIRVEEMREVERRLNLACPRNSLKVAVILDADRLSPEAANAFLKTLEEPPRQCLILLLTAQPGQLLPTIRSRCLHLPLYRLGARRLSEAERRLLGEMGRRQADGAGGGLGGALGMLQVFGEILKEVKVGIEKEHEAAQKEEEAIYRQRTEGDWLKQREEYYKALTEALYLERREDLLQALLAWYGDALRAGQGMERPVLAEFAGDTARAAASLETGELLRRIRSIEELRENLQTNVQEGLALEVGFLEVFG